jgi:Nucleoside permease
LVLISLVTLANYGLAALPYIGGEAITLERVAGWIFAPIAWCMGIPWVEAQLSGSLLGVKTILNEFVAYVKLAEITPNELSEKSRLIMLYALCGFANLSSVGILLGGMGTMVPERKEDLIFVSGKALIGATLASCFTGLVVGIIS